jgi:hypothetical protein
VRGAKLHAGELCERVHEFNAQTFSNAVCSIALNFKGRHADGDRAGLRGNHGAMARMQDAGADNDEQAGSYQC